MKKRTLTIVEEINGQKSSECKYAYFVDEENNNLYSDKKRDCFLNADEIQEKFELKQWDLDDIKFDRHINNDDLIILSDYELEIGKFTRKLSLNELLKYSWNRDCVLCNNIHNVDETIFDNARFDWGDVDSEILQWYITSFSESDAEYLSEHSDLLITYSNMLDCYVMCLTEMRDWNELMIPTDLPTK